MDKISMKILNDILAPCIGTESYHKDFTGVVYTDGVKLMAETAQAYWLITAIGSVQKEKKLFLLPFQLWTIIAKDGKAVIECREDSDEPIKYKQEIEFTTFPDGQMKFYLIDNVLLLTSEY